ncbi:MAG TPA: ribonuclease III [Polyangiaceae bacterium]|jgi:ribonuclease-3|nr:ribonuclease III [Polyangiaceae bacterium]
MSDDDLALAREALRLRLESLVGAGPLPRFEEALTHPSFANETGGQDNQRLEFLGDAVLGLCVSEMLVASHVDADEGKLTRMRSALVNGEALASWARSVDLGGCVAFGRGAKLGSEREQTNVLADAAEALVAAVYESRGLEGARALVSEVVRERYEHAETLSAADPKSALQERVQAQGMPSPTYRLAEVRGTPHDQVFVIEVVVGEQALARGEGRSKRQAERAAASEALKVVEPEPRTDE